MTVAELIDVLNTSPARPRRVSSGAPALARTVTAIAYDSRQVEPGAMFVALKGQHADGLAFARQALSRGAAAVVAESDPAEEPPAGAAAIVVDDARLALAVLAAAFSHHPSHAMQVVGITGTNGKTTTAYLASAVLEAAGIRTGLIGTVMYRIGEDEREAARTTPEAPDLQRLLGEMVDRGCGACVMEVSSHALALRRVDETRFAAAVFTNLTRDHLDFHEDMEAYFQAKRRLFEMLPAGAPAVINLDDPRGESLVPVASRAITYGIERPAQVRPGGLSFSLEGLAFSAETPSGTVQIRSALMGRPNVYNILAAVATGVSLDLPLEVIEQGVARVTRVPGRFQVVSEVSDPVIVVVDYAHTDDALKNLLETARPLAPRRLITVFGCGGDRDRAKRPLMGAVAVRLSDLVVITSDNPRSEDPARIIEEIKRGIPGAAEPPRGDTPGRAAPRARSAGSPQPDLVAIVDRREAIDRAIGLAQPGDLVLIAGKGHERYQIIGSRVLPFDDVVVAREALARRRTVSRMS